MNTLNSSSLVLTVALVATSHFAFGDPPPNVVESDAERNTAMGTDALLGLTTGVDNTAAGFEALVGNTEGSHNSAFGMHALRENTLGTRNTAIGGYALRYNTTGTDNTAVGRTALFDNSTGAENTAIGVYALFRNTTGNYNTASGSDALNSNTTGSGNAALGYSALFKNKTGFRNSAVGQNALVNNTSGRYNTAIGYGAGQKITAGNDNVAVANPGVTGDSHTMRLGKQGSEGTIGSGVTRTFIAGINAVSTGMADAVPVVIDSNGQLGTINSSRRFKEDIQPMGSTSERLRALRPVTFRYKQPFEDGSTPVQFGLVAEEVAAVFPELVVYGEDGEPQTVRYHLLATLLLNELQKQHRIMQDQVARVATLEKRAQELAQLQVQVATMAKMIDLLNDARLMASQ